MATEACARASTKAKDPAHSTRVGRSESVSAYVPEVEAFPLGLQVCGPEFFACPRAGATARSAVLVAGAQW